MKVFFRSDEVGDSNNLPRSKKGLGALYLYDGVSDSPDSFVLIGEHLLTT